MSLLSSSSCLRTLFSNIAVSFVFCVKFFKVSFSVFKIKNINFLCPKMNECYRIIKDSVLSVFDFYKHMSLREISPVRYVRNKEKLNKTRLRLRSLNGPNPVGLRNMSVDYATYNAIARSSMV